LLNARHIPDVTPQAILILIEDVTDRRESEHKLLLSEVRYRKLFETAKDGIILIDPVTEKIIDANPFLLALIRYSKEEILGKELWEIGAVQDISYAKKMFEELQATGYVRYEDIPIKSKDGQEHEVEFVSNRYPIDGTEMIQCNIRDITERKAAEKKAAMYLEGLEKLNKMMTGRELTMIELKKEIQILKEKLNPAEG
jgi:PAS domain S-box-containing protein